MFDRSDAGTGGGTLPLDDLSVIDLSVARAGPTCVRQLADWGAEVIRVEVPSGVGDPNALLGSRESSDYQNLHRNKRSLTLDLKSNEGRGLLLRLVESADVLIESMRPGVMGRLGLSYETLKARNPRIVMGSISGFGQTGPYASRGGVDQVAQGMGGLMSVTGLPGTEPTRMGIAVSDMAAGLYLSFGIMAALHERERTGDGQWVQTSLIEAAIGMMDFQITRYTVDGQVPEQAGNHHPTSVPMGCFPTADGHVNVAGAAGRLLASFCEVVGLPDLPADPRFDTTEKRSSNRAELNELVSQRLSTRCTSDWVMALEAAGVPAGPVYRVDQAMADPQVVHLQMVQPVQSPKLGTLNLVRNPVTSSHGIDTVRSATPAHGAHSTEILRELGLSVAEIDSLRSSHII